jgi:hypothetical protein
MRIPQANAPHRARLSDTEPTGQSAWDLGLALLRTRPIPMADLAEALDCGDRSRWGFGDQGQVKSRVESDHVGRLSGNDYGPYLGQISAGLIACSLPGRSAGALGTRAHSMMIVHNDLP